MAQGILMVHHRSWLIANSGANLPDGAPGRRMTTHSLDAHRCGHKGCQTYLDPISWETYLEALAIVIPGKWVESSQLHPPPAELLRGIQCKATYVSTYLEGHTGSSKGVHPPLLSTRDLQIKLC